MRRFLHRLFLHNASAERASKLLRTGASVGMLAMVIISFTAANLQALLWQSSHWLVSTVLPSVVVELTNDERTGLAERPLTRSAVLDAAATLKAEDMAKHGYFSHFSPDGVSPWHWFDQAGYVYAHAGENLAIHFSDSGAVVEAWMNSPSHRANIVSENYTEIGVGTAKGVYEGYDTVFVVQLFGSPADLSQAAKPVAPVVATAPQLPTVTFVATTTASVPTITGVVLAASDTEAVVAVQPAVIDPAVATNADATTSITTASSALLASDMEMVTTVPVQKDAPPEAMLKNGLVMKAPEYEQPETEFAIKTINIDKDVVSMYSGTMATSSGYPMYVHAPGEASGTTKMAMIGRLATQPSTLLQMVYLVLGSIVGMMLLLSLFLGLRSERPWQIVYSCAMLVLMGGLVTIHVYLTMGATVV